MYQPFALPNRGGYTLRATDVGNINNEFAASSPFSIGPEASTSSPLPSYTSSTSSFLAFPSGSAASTASGSATTLSVSSMSAFGMTISSPAASSRLGTSGGTGSGTTTAAQEVATNSNDNGAASVGMGLWVLGAAVVGLGWVAERY